MTGGPRSRATLEAARFTAGEYGSDQSEPRAQERARQIFEERTRLLATRSSGVKADRDAVLILECGNEAFALRVADAAEVLAMKVTTTLPRARPGLLGIVDRRGVLCCVYDLAVLCGLPSRDVARSSGHLVILRRSGGRVGLRVDRASTIQEVAPADLLPSEEASVASLGQYTRGGLNLLDPDMILSRTDGASQHVV
jgi:chemotaxis signal transduction protein